MQDEVTIVSKKRNPRTPRKLDVCRDSAEKESGTKDTEEGGCIGKERE